MNERSFIIGIKQKGAGKPAPSCIGEKLLIQLWYRPRYLLRQGGNSLTGSCFRQSGS